MEKIVQPTLSDLERLAREAGAILRAGYNREHQVNYKGVIDLVTEVDHQSEAFLLGEITAKFPDHHIVAEESGVIQGNVEHSWFVDPLDGRRRAFESQRCLESVSSLPESL